ncbi:MAG TPA: beta-phosphoglucomutase family hydrolase [Anaerolineaceae bacterium]|nr:beta-phosphoglucomutase family hydrolase [Anaerolineaceae bacterium]
MQTETDLPPFSAILWDMDGVLVDTFDGHFHAWKQTFDEMEHPFTLEDFRRTFGMNNCLIFRTLLGRELEEMEFQRLSDRKEELFRTSIRGTAQTLPSVRDWLERFKGWGIRQAVASSAPQANIDALLDELGIRGYFQAVVEGATLRGKPDPAVFLLAAQLLGAKPSRCLVIEDSVAGVEAARRAGMCCVAVCTTNPPEKLTAADLIVQDLSSLTQEQVLSLATPLASLGGA